MTTPNLTIERGIRAGTTILEVLFAIGIVIVGILGIASLLPLAASNANRANEASISQSLAQDWYAEAVTRGVLDTSGWAWYQDYDYSLPANAPTYPNAIAEAHGTKYGFVKKSPTDERLSTRTSGSLASAGGATLIDFSKQSICIDPGFYADRELRRLMGAGVFSQSNATYANHWYRPNVFPGFQDGFNPTTDPFYRQSDTSGLAWADQPRMLRVTLGSSALGTMNAKFVEQMFFSQDDLSIVMNDADRTIPAERGFHPFTTPTTTLPAPIGRAAVKGEYSWLATLSPLEAADTSVENQYTLSLVVMHRRDPVYFDPTDSTSLVNRTGVDLPDPRQKPGGERLAWVVPLSGAFNGGNGGRVRLVSTDGFDDDVLIGQWIMLGKFYTARVRSLASGATYTQKYPIFRWYRIVGVDERAEVQPLSAAVGGSDPYGNVPPAGNNVWYRDVVLEGPDWDFSSPQTVLNESTGVVEGSLITPTTATLLSGAISVYERVVQLP